VETYRCLKRTIKPKLALNSYVFIHKDKGGGQAGHAVSFFTRDYLHRARKMDGSEQFFR